MKERSPETGRAARHAAAIALAAIGVVACGDRDEGGATGSDGGEAAPETAPAGAPGTFTPSASALDAKDDDSRLPAPGDRTLYIPATELFPGSARLDPAIENPYSGDKQAIDAGQRHFAAFNCAGCHAPLGGGGTGPPLSDDVWIYGSEPAQMYLSIMHGRPQGMPAWSSMLPRQTVWELVAYIETLSEIEDYAAKKGFDSAGSRSGGENETGSDSTEASQ